MLNKLHDFQEFLTKKENFCRVSNQRLVEIVNKYRILYFSTENINAEIEDNIKESKVIVINNYEEDISGTKILFFIFGIKNFLLIIAEDTLPNFVKKIQEINAKVEFSFIPNTKDIFDQNVQNEYKEFKNLFNDEFFQEELNSFNRQISINNNKEIWKIIFPCISGYLIKQSYSKTKYDRIEEFKKNQNQSNCQKIFEEEEYFELRRIGSGASYETKLIYHISDEQFYVIKKPFGLNDKRNLSNREMKNYEIIEHPFIPKYYGKTKDGCLVIEFINGKTIERINEIEFMKYFKLTESDKIKIIFELLKLFKYLHNNLFVYRDLKPDNVMIDEKKQPF